MSRTTFFLLIIFLILIGVGIFSYLFFYTSVFEGFGGQAGDKVRSIRNFLPFGDLGKTIGIDKEGEGEEPVIKQPKDITGEPAPRLMKLVANPVAGFTSYINGSSTVVRYIEKSSGRVFDIDMSIPSARTRITNTTIPRVREAFFSQNGSNVLIRYLDDGGSIQSYYSQVPKATSSEAFRNGVDLKGSFLAENIVDVSVLPSSGRLFSMIISRNSAVGTVSDYDGNKKSQIFESPFTEWLSSWVNDKTILLVTKPSYAAPGFAYSLDVKTGAMKKIYGGTSGLTAVLSPDGKKFLISEDGSSLKIYDMTDHSIFDIGLKTITDKCVWATSNTIYCGIPNKIAAANYPDAWYQGIVQFTDSIWIIDLDLSVTETVWEMTSEENIDAFNLSTSKDLEYLFFTNKKDGSLWSLKLR